MVQTFFLFPQKPRVRLRIFFLRALEATLFTERGMVCCNYDSVNGLDGEHGANPGHIGFMHHSGMGKEALALLPFLGQDVAFISMFPFDLSRAGDLKTLLGTGIGFHLGHIG